jgi:hypothetical protein
MTGITLAHAMASDFTVAWQKSQREQFFLIKDQTPCHVVLGIRFVSSFDRFLVILTIYMYLFGLNHAH